MVKGEGVEKIEISPIMPLISVKENHWSWVKFSLGKVELKAPITYLLCPG